MTHGAIDAGSNVRRVIESHMGFLDESIHTLPRHLFSSLRMIAKRLNSRIVGIANVFMTSHAKTDAWNSGTCAAVHARMALVALDSDLVNLMNLMREVDRLLRFGLDA